MTALAQVAAAYRTHQALVIQLADQRTAAQWATLDPADLSGSWASVTGPAMATTVTAGQQLAAASAQTYIGASLRAQDATAVASADGTVQAASFAGTAADGRSLASLLYLPVIATKTAIAGGAGIPDALAIGAASLSTIVQTEVGDAGRNALQAGMTVDRAVHGYVRMVAGSACSRCIVLAGKFYRWNASFQRHPRCHCTGIPALENRPDLRTDPHAFFDHLSPAEQNARFGKADAQAIREGADMFQVVNAHRGLSTRELFGRQVQTTSEGMTRRGIAHQRIAASTKAGAPRVRLSVAQIYRDAGTDRDLAISLLRKYAYIL